jgi:hypothetical protein
MTESLNETMLSGNLPAQLNLTKASKDVLAVQPKFLTAAMSTLVMELIAGVVSCTYMFDY